MRECDLVNLHLEGCSFTWERGRGTAGFVQVKLDRVMANEPWLGLFEGTMASSMVSAGSDRLAVYLMLQTSRIRENVLLWVSCDILSLRMYGCGKMNARRLLNRVGIRVGGLDIQERVVGAGVELGRWGQRFVSNFITMIEGCKKDLLRLCSEGGGRYLEAQQAYIRLLGQQEYFWRKRASPLWLGGGDLNTRYFHNSVREKEASKWCHATNGNWGLMGSG